MALLRSAGSGTLPARPPGPGKRSQARVSLADRAPAASEARSKALSKVHSIISIPPHRESPGLPEGPAPTASLMFTVAGKQRAHTAWATFLPRNVPRACKHHTQQSTSACPCEPPATARREPSSTDCWRPVPAHPLAALVPSSTGRNSETDNQDLTVQHTRGWSESRGAVSVERTQIVTTSHENIMSINSESCHISITC